MILLTSTFAFSEECSGDEGPSEEPDDHSVPLLRAVHTASLQDICNDFDRFWEHVAHKLDVPNRRLYQKSKESAKTEDGPYIEGTRFSEESTQEATQGNWHRRIGCQIEGRSEELHRDFSSFL